MLIRLDACSRACRCVAMKAAQSSSSRVIVVVAAAVVVSCFAGLIKWLLLRAGRKEIISYIGRRQ